jgi:hypothetical protein
VGVLPDFTVLARAEDADIKRRRSQGPESIGAGPGSREDPMSAALRTTQATPSMRPLGVAFGGIVIAAAIVGLLAFGQLATAKPQTISAAGAAPVTHDHGWSSAAAAVSAPVLNDRGWATAPSIVVSAPVLHDRGWATAPSAASAPSSGSRSVVSGGSNGTRFRK